MDSRRLADFLRDQDQVVSRSQVVACDGNDNDIARMVRRREWAPVHPGVYVAHNGPLSTRQREWAAVLYCQPAAITGISALRRHGLRIGRESEQHDSGDIVHIAIARDRRIAERPGIRVTRTKVFGAAVLDNLSPPRIRLEHAVLQYAAGTRNETACVGAICDAVQSRRTTPARLLAALEALPRLRHRALLQRILADVALGAHSVLEREYLLRVERAHSLPSGARQRWSRAGRSTVFRDVEYPHQATLVELDGRLGHERALDRWDDLERDVEALVEGSLTLRLGWAQVLDACRCASSVAKVLSARGWTGSPQKCSVSCSIGAISGAGHAKDAGQAPQID